MPHTVTGCPGDLDSTGKARYALVKKDFGPDWQDVFAATLERYVRSLAQVDEALTVIAEMGGMAELITRGSQGQKVQHPIWSTYQQAQRLAADSATALCLTPQARKRVGDAKAAPPSGGALSGLL